MTAISQLSEQYPLASMRMFLVCCCGEFFVKHLDVIMFQKYVNFCATPSNVCCLLNQPLDFYVPNREVTTLLGDAVCYYLFKGIGVELRIDTWVLFFYLFINYIFYCSYQWQIHFWKKSTALTQVSFQLFTIIITWPNGQLLVIIKYRVRNLVNAAPCRR